MTSGDPNLEQMLCQALKTTLTTCIEPLTECFGPEDVEQMRASTETDQKKFLVRIMDGKVTEEVANLCVKGNPPVGDTRAQYDEYEYDDFAEDDYDYDDDYEEGEEEDGNLGYVEPKDSRVDFDSDGVIDSLDDDDDNDGIPDDEDLDDDNDGIPDDLEGGSPPTGYPQNHETTIDCNNENCWIKVDWEPPRRDDWMSCLLGYRLGFRKAGQHDWAWMNDEGTHRDLRSDKLFFFEEAEGTNHSLTIKNLEHQTEYEVTLKVFNPYGEYTQGIKPLLTPPGPFLCFPRPAFIF